MHQNWSNIEVELIVADYFDMLQKELSGINYSKAEHRRNLLILLNNRSEGSIEFKHQNISAVLINLGLPFLSGYLPRFNYQKMLSDIIIEYLKLNRNIEFDFNRFVENDKIENKEEIDFKNLIDTPPISNSISEPKIEYGNRPIKINYIKREQQNQKLGMLGEELVLNFEKWNLRQQGKEKLSEQIRWISKEDGDGVGFDILSKHSNGKDKFIEVKTTRLRKETPFYFTHRELEVSEIKLSDYFVYRIFNFENNVKFFIKNGSFRQICNYTPITYKGYF